MHIDIAPATATHIFTPRELISFKNMGTHIEVVYKYPSTTIYGNGEEVPSKVIKEIYGYKDGNIVLLESIEGKYTPAFYTPENISF